MKGFFLGNVKRVVLIACILFVLDFGLTVILWELNYHIVTEGNPLIHLENRFIIFYVNIGYIIMIGLLSLYLKHYKTIVIESKNAFLYMVALYKSDHYKFLIASSFFSIIIGSFISRSIAILDWVLFGLFHEAYFESFYYHLRDQMPFQRFDILVGILSFIIVWPLWFKFEHKKIKHLSKK